MIIIMKKQISKRLFAVLEKSEHVLCKNKNHPDFLDQENFENA